MMHTNRPTHAQGNNRQEPDPSWIRGIDLRKPDLNLFDEKAHNAAQKIAQDRNRNKTAQLRKFYDEIMMWESRIRQYDDDTQESKLKEFLPFIRMINAKAAYAEGRKLVDIQFVKLLQHTINQISDPQSLTHCKYFWEAFMGFYKQERPD